MEAKPQRTGAERVKAPQWHQPKWHWIYFLLAAFDLFTLLLSLYINHQIMAIYTNSIAVNQEWAKRLERYSYLRQLAGAVNAPGNDVFDSRNVEAESENMRKARRLFDREMLAVREDLAVHVTKEEEAERLLKDLDAIDNAMDEMTAEALLIFSFFERGEPGPAGKRMATMDRKYHKVNTAFAFLNEHVHQVQEKHFAQQMAAAAFLQKFEYVIAGLILLMVCGATLYGQKLSKQALALAQGREQHLKALRESEERFQVVARATNDVIWDWDLVTNRVWWNEGVFILFRYAKDQVGPDVTWWVEHIHPEDRERVVSGVHAVIDKSGRFWSDEYRFYRGDGSYAYIFDRGYVVRDENGDPVRMIGAMMDITERKQAEERLSYLASYDSLTNLPNRVLFYDRLNQVLSRAPWSKRLVGVLFLDLDRFKIINDTLGHNVGDGLLKAVAERLKGCVRAGDTVARLGGDEFTVILDDVAKEQDVTKIAQKILDTLSKPYRIEGHELFTTTSIGISLYPHDGETAETLLKNADIAMYRAKEQGKNNFQHYSSAMNAKASERLSLENRLRHALEGDEFRLIYQPQLDLKSGQIIGMEALVRWQHPEMGLLSPAKFIPVAEETGLIIPMGEWVLRTACAQNRAWQTAGYASMRIAVNFSARQFQQQNMIKMVSGVLQETGLAPHFLELELTESIIMKNAENTIVTLCQLHEMGLEISIDDFGTGYSSLSYLRRFPINRLKVDPSFVHDITTDPINAEIVNAIITMAHSLKIKVIAESVETAEQLRILRSLECDEIQGYLLSPPLSPQEATKLWAEGEDLSQRLPHKC